MLEKDLVNKIKSLTEDISADEFFFDSNKEKFLNYVKKEFASRDFLVSTENKNKNEEEVINTNIKTRLVKKESTLMDFLFGKFRVSTLVLGSSAALLIAGGTTVSFSKGALPQDPLYSLKLTMENLQVAFSLKDEDNVRMQIDITGNRINELSRILNSDMPKIDKEKVAKQLVNTIEDGMSSIPTKVAVLDKTNSVNIRETVKNVDDRIDEYNNVLENAKGLAKNNDLGALGNDINTALINSNHVSVKNFNVIINNLGTDDVAKKDIANRIEKKIDNIKNIISNESSVNSYGINSVSSDNSYGYANSGSSSDMIAKLDEMKIELNKVKVGIASDVDLDSIINKVDQALENKNNLILVNPNEKINNAIDLNKKTDYGYSYGEKINDSSYGKSESVTPDFTAETVKEEEMKVFGDMMIDSSN